MGHLLPAFAFRPAAVRTAAAFCLLAAMLAALPARAADELRWFTGGRPNADAAQALELLNDAGGDGLDPADYEAARLARAFADAQATPPADAANLDHALTEAMRRYLRDLHLGRVDPRSVHENFSVPPDASFDAAAVLDAARAAHDLPAAVERLRPRLPLYASLRKALADYRALESSPAWQAPLPAPARNKLEPGQDYAGLAVLAERLAALGDLPAGTAPPARYEGALADAVKAFQERHGLAADGVIGKATRAQLDASPAQRVRQIELALERLRWVPLLQGPRMIVVNIPEFVLRAYDVRPDGQVDVRLSMRVIVGKALDTRTPVFDEDMRFIEFSPYWNVPPSIVRKETVPRLRRDPGYFEREGFEFVSGDGRAIRALNEANIDALQRGALRIRQRPGPKNALGDVKFVFPNNDNIYLHHTPSVQLFARDQRDLSHGCIRVEDPVGLAKFVLADMPDWTEERIRAAMAKGESSTLKLKDPVPVVIAYGTAIVKSTGKLNFFADLYGHDKLLDAALRQRRPAAHAAPGAGAQ